jgi:hypothetical protein
MKSILICKDCLDQFESTKHDQCLNLINNVSQCQTPIYFTTCMGVCPLEKISVIELTKDVINDIVFEPIRSLNNSTVLYYDN